MSIDDPSVAVKTPAPGKEKSPQNYFAAAVASANALFIVSVLALFTLAVIGAFVGAAFWLSGSDSILMIIIGMLVLFSAAKKLAPAIVETWKKIFFPVPPVTLGIKRFLGKETGRALDVGLHVIWPYLETVDLVPNGLKRGSFSVKFPTLDTEKQKRKWMIVEASFHFRRDPGVKRDGKSVCLEFEDDAVIKGISDHVQEKLSTLGHKITDEEFLNNLPAIADFIECYLRLADMPHPYELDAAEVPKYYSEHRTEVKAILGREHLDPARSHVEQLFGQDIPDFAVISTDFTPETQKAMEKEAQVIENAKAFGVRTANIKDLIAIGLSPQQAKDEVDLTLDPSIKETIVSIEGNSSAVVVPANLFGGGRSGGNRNDDNGNESRNKKGGRR